jgi:hypothetical protein
MNEFDKKRAEVDAHYKNEEQKLKESGEATVSEEQSSKERKDDYRTN